MKSLILLATLATSLTGYAATQNNKQKNEECKSKELVPLRAPIPLYETKDNSGYSVGMRADLLYMTYSSPALTYASERSITGVGVTPTLNSTILSVPGQMNLGCDLALNYTLESQPGYSFETSWYYMDVEFSRSNSGNILLAHAVALTTGAPGTVSIKGHLLINFFDLMIQKQFAFGDWFKITPATGLVGGFMHSQSRANTSATSGNFGNSTTVASLNQFIKYEGIGMKFGAKTSFKIWREFRLTADIFYSVLYGLTKAELDYSSDGSFGPSLLAAADSSYKQHHGRAFVDSLLGLAWETRFRNDSLYLDLHAGWRIQSFSQGWMEYEASLNDSIQNLPLLGQGLQLGATFKF